jgi:anhydro-N-acetylmuramic acid kinase
MVYKIVSVLCNELSRGFSTAYVELQYQGGGWSADNFIKTRHEYPNEWKQHLSILATLPVAGYINMHNEWGKYLSNAIKEFITTNNLEFKVQLIALKGFDAFEQNELGNPAQVAALTNINVVGDFRGVDTALDGNGNYSDSIAAALLNKEAPEIQLALLAVLRWREENNFLAGDTGAKRNSISGAIWMGQEA